MSDKEMNDGHDPQDECAPNILLVEDNEADALLIGRRIRSLYPACNLVVSKSLGGAYDVYLKEKLDIILLDLNLPDGFGHRTADEALSFAKDIPIIVLTGMGNSVTVKESLKMGIKEVLMKSKLMETGFEDALKRCINQ